MRAPPESITSTRPAKSFAASAADSQVPESLADRCTDRTASWPAPRSRSYSSANAAGVGRDVLTDLPAANASATAPGATPTPSWAPTPSMTTVSGTTVRPARSGAGNAAVESVTTATLMPGTLADRTART
ncbi:hypothetical protein GCM10009558_088150 [Virgisporangium aurantiacum]